MARDDDDDRGPNKRSRDDDERDGTDELADDDRGRTKGSRPDGDKMAKPYKPMPTRLVGAIIAALAWGFISLNASCLQSSHDIVQEVQIHKLKRDFGVNFKIEGDGAMTGMRYTQYGVHLFFLLASVLLVAGGIMLLLRMSIGKFIAMGTPVVMFILEFAGFVICLIITKGTFFGSSGECVQ